MKKGRDVQHEVRESAHKVWLAGLGALAAAGEEGKAMFQTLVERGETVELRSKKEVSKVRGKVQDAKAGVEVMLGRVSEKFDESVAAALQRLGVPTRKEIATLTKRVEELTKGLEKVRPAAARPAARNAATKKPAAKKAAAKKAAAPRPTAAGAEGAK